MIEYIILSCLILSIIISIIILFKNTNEAKITRLLGKLETNTVKELSEYQPKKTEKQNP